MPKKRKKQNTITQAPKPKLIDLKELFRGETVHFLLGLCLLCIAIFMTLAFISYLSTAAHDQSYLEAVTQSQNNVATGIPINDHIENQAGKLGALTANFFMNHCFGLTAFFIPLFLVFAAMRLMRTYRFNLWTKFLHYAFLMIWGSVALAFFIPNEFLDHFAFLPGGMHGKEICETMTALIGVPGLLIVLVVTAIFYLVILSQSTIPRIKGAARYIAEHIKLKRTSAEDFAPATVSSDDPSALIPRAAEDVISKPIDLTGTNTDAKNSDAQMPEGAPEEAHPSEDTEMEVSEGKKEVKAKGSTVAGEYDPKLDLEFYKYPTLDLLRHYDEGRGSVDMAELQANKERITTILHNFGVEISSIKATVGPTVTLYEITPQAGVRISKIKNLEDDIALSLSALGIRIIAPIPGKGTIGIEVPNKKPRIVSMESILNTETFQESHYELPMALGKTITNEVFMADLVKMPHLLVAGATGQGKSVGLNAIITSLLYKKHPSELKMVMVDPKKVEFSIYAPLARHFLATLPEEADEPIITDVEKVVKTLKSLCQEMDDRYALLKRAHEKNILEYNKKFKSRRLSPDQGFRYLPYIVVIIDEFGDLIMTAGKNIELPIARIAQLGRAAGMHMIIATQRPTTNIITGNIKANFPARMAFRVSSGIDSRTILDQGGANQLVGRGDMLFLAGSTPQRLQCAFVDTPEVERITEFIANQQGYLEPYRLPEVVENGEGISGSPKEGLEKIDPMFEEAARMVVINQQGSTSFLQRKFSIGYNRAGRIMDQLEDAGIVGPANGAKPRDVIFSTEAELEQRLAELRNAGH